MAQIRMGPSNRNHVFLSLVLNQYGAIYDINLYQVNHSTKKLTQKDPYK